MYDLVVWCVALLATMALAMLGLNKLANIVDFESRELSEVDFTHRVNEYAMHEAALNIGFAAFHLLLGPYWFAAIVLPAAAHSAYSLWTSTHLLDVTQSHRGLPRLKQEAYARAAAYAISFFAALLGFARTAALETGVSRFADPNFHKLLHPLAMPFH